MATLSAALLQGTEKNNIPRSKRKLQKHLRSSGLAYISRTGKLIPAKKVPEQYKTESTLPIMKLQNRSNIALNNIKNTGDIHGDELCQCPQKCDERVPMEARERLFKHFYGLGDADLQNAFLRDHMDVRARTNIPESTNSGRSPRRITCKYLVPLISTGQTADVCQKAFVSAFVITTKRVRLQREKLISSMGLNSYSSHSRTSKSFSMSENKHSLTLKNSMMVTIPSQCDIQRCDDTRGMTEPVPIKPLRRLVDDPLVPFGLFVPEGVTIAPVTATPDHDRDIAIVNNFFSNQLWKPEYIGTYS